MARSEQEIPTDPNPTARTVAALEAELLHRERQINAIRRITGALFSSVSVDDMVRETLAVAIEVMQADVGSILLHNPANNTLVFRYVTNPADAPLVNLAIPSDHGIAGQVFRTGQAQLSDNSGEGGRINRAIDDLSGYRTDSMLTAPLRRFGGEPIGVMQILNARHRFDQRDLEALESLCSQAAAAIESARLAEEAGKAEIVNVLGDITHDIKNMLTPLQSGVWMLKPLLAEMFESLQMLREEGPKDETWSDAIGRTTRMASENYGWILQAVSNSSERVQACTQEIANAVKGEMTPPNFEDADLNETASEVADSLRPVAERAGLDLVLDLDEQLPVLSFDRRQMYHALYNLVNNAIPETPSGGRITVSTRAPLEAEGVVRLEVQDTGRGMAPLIRDRLFTDAAISSKRGGTGLGTRIVAGVMRRHGARIEVQSEEGRGTLIRIHLPTAPREP